MAFWSEPENLIPKQSHRWVVSFSDFERQENNPDVLPPYIFKSIDRPSFETGVIQAKHLYSQTFNFPKRVTWKPIKVELNDVIIKDSKITMPGNKKGRENSRDEYTKTTQLFIYSILLKSGYFAINKAVSFGENILLKKYTFKDNLINAFFSDYRTNTDKQIRIKELSPNGLTQEWWTLHNPFINNINFNKLDYSSDNVISITFDIIYDWAELHSYPMKIDTGPSMTGGPANETPRTKLVAPTANGRAITPAEAQQLLNEGKATVEQLNKEWLNAVGVTIPTNPPQIQTAVSPPPQPTPIRPSEIIGDPTGGIGRPIVSKPPDLSIGSLTSEKDRQSVRNKITDLPE